MTTTPQFSGAEAENQRTREIDFGGAEIVVQGGFALPRMSRSIDEIYLAAANCTPPGAFSAGTDSLGKLASPTCNSLPPLARHLCSAAGVAEACDGSAKLAACAGRRCGFPWRNNLRNHETAQINQHVRPPTKQPSGPSVVIFILWMNPGITSDWPPISNTGIYILDKASTRAIGVRAKIFIGGEGVAAAI